MNQIESSANYRERFHPRVEANFMVGVVLSNRTVVAKATDLSMNGLFLCAFPPAKVTHLTVTLPLPQDRMITARCVIRRENSRGVALEFERLDWDDLFALARFLNPRLP